MKKYLKALGILVCLSLVMFLVACGGSKGQDNKGVTKESAQDFFEVLKVVGATNFFVSDPEDFYKDGLSPYYYPVFGVEYVSMLGEDFDETYISEAEKSEYIDPTYFYTVFDIDVVQHAIDSIWGRDRIDAGKWTFSSGSGTFVSSKGYIIQESGFGDNGEMEFFKVMGFRNEGDYGILSVKCLVQSIFDYTVYDAGAWGHAPLTVLDVNQDIEMPGSFDDLLNLCGIPEEDVVTMELVMYNTPEGVRLLEAAESKASY